MEWLTGTFGIECNYSRLEASFSGPGRLEIPRLLGKARGDELDFYNFLCLQTFGSFCDHKFNLLSFR
jgi:hypothetical protein